MFNVKTPISKIALILNARTEGMSFNATCRTHHISQHTLQDWENKFGGIRDALLLYSLTHTFVEMIIEGDELYTKVNKNVPPSESEGWTISLMDRASRFIWELTCDKKEEALFLQAMEQLVEVIEKTDEFKHYSQTGNAGIVHCYSKYAMIYYGQDTEAGPKKS